MTGRGVAVCAKTFAVLQCEPVRRLSSSESQFAQAKGRRRERRQSMKMAAMIFFGKMVEKNLAVGDLGGFR
jgi:hypothetical protein